MTASNRVTFLTSDGEILSADRAAFEKSSTVQNFFANIEDPNAEMPLPNIRGTVMKVIIRWCEHHLDAPRIRYNHDVPYPPNAFDNQLMNECNSILYELIIGATFLELMGLCGICAGKVAQNVRGMDVEEMREYFQLAVDSDDEN